MDNLKDQLFEKLEQSLGDVQLHLDGKIGFSAKPDDSAKQELPNHIPAAHEVGNEFSSVERTFWTDQNNSSLILITHIY